VRGRTAPVALDPNPSKRREQITALVASVFAKEARHGESIDARESRAVMLASGSTIDLANGIAEPVGERPPPGVDLEWWVRERAELAVGVAALHRRALATAASDDDVPLPDGWIDDSERRANLAAIRAQHPIVAAQRRAALRAADQRAADKGYEEALALLASAVPPPNRPAPLRRHRQTLVRWPRPPVYRVKFDHDGHAIVMDGRGVRLPDFTIDVATCMPMRRVKPTLVAAAAAEPPASAPTEAPTEEHGHIGLLLRTVERLANRKPPDVHVTVEAAKAPDVHVTVEAAERPRVIRVEVDDDGTKRYISEDT
jgi:hypothetical protein